MIVALKTPYDDGTSHVVLSPMEFMGRLAALVPRPRGNLTRFHGVFSPNSQLREYVVPASPDGRRGPECGTTAAARQSCIQTLPDHRRCHGRSIRGGWRNNRAIQARIPGLRLQRQRSWIIATDDPRGRKAHGKVGLNDSAIRRELKAESGG